MALLSFESNIFVTDSIICVDGFKFHHQYNRTENHYEQSKLS